MLKEGILCNNNNKLLQVKNLVKHFPISKGIIFSKVAGVVKAVDDISFDIIKNTTFGLVGESGCGKSTTGRLLLRLIEPDSGEIIFKGRNLTELSKREMSEYRKDMQMIFQDPFTSLNPKMKIQDILAEPIIIHRLAFGKKQTERIHELLDIVGLSWDYAGRYPHELSGGQRQRIGIARALALEPELIICDEPVSALDVSIQAQIINLLLDLQDEFGLTYIFIAHDLSIVKHISDTVAVMYLGKIVELAAKAQLFDKPQHPYTKSLLNAVPIPDPALNRKRAILAGEIPSAINPPTGCQFHPRCPYVMDICRKKSPKWKDIGSNHYVTCHLF